MKHLIIICAGLVLCGCENKSQQANRSNRLLQNALVKTRGGCEYLSVPTHAGWWTYVHKGDCTNLLHRSITVWDYSRTQTPAEVQPTNIGLVRILGLVTNYNEQGARVLLRVSCQDKTNDFAVWYEWQERLKTLTMTPP